MSKTIRVAAVQLATSIGDSTANIAACERLALQAVNEGARWIALPEFFNTGIAWDPDRGADHPRIALWPDRVSHAGTASQVPRLLRG